MEAGLPFRTAFDVSPTMRRGWQALVRFPMVLFVGALLKACTEAGNGAGGQSRGDWDPGHSATEASRHIRDGQWDQVVDGLPAPLAAMGAGVIVALVLTAFVLAVAIRAFVHGGWIAVHQEILRDGVARWERCSRA